MARKNRWCGGSAAVCLAHGERHLAQAMSQPSYVSKSRVQKRRFRQQFRLQARRRKLAKLKKHTCSNRARERRGKLLAAQCKAARKLKLLTWNTRGWGAVYSQFDPVVRTRNMLDFLDSKGVGLAVLTDVKFPVQGLRKFQSAAQEWMVLRVYQPGARCPGSQVDAE